MSMIVQLQWKSVSPGEYSLVHRHRMERLDMDRRSQYQLSTLNS